MTIVNKNVLVHSCKLVKEMQFRASLIPGQRYVGELGLSLESQQSYYPLPASCRCRKFMTSQEITDAVVRGAAVWLLRVKKGAVIPDDHAAWMPQVRGKVPRVDLVSRSDIERALFGSERKSKHYKFDRELKKYVVIKAPEGISEVQWRKDAQDEVKYEKRIMRDYSNYISEIHDLYMRNRAALIVPPRDDPWEGRSLFTFGPDMRTAGGH